MKKNIKEVLFFKCFYTFFLFSIFFLFPLCSWSYDESSAPITVNTQATSLESTQDYTFTIPPEEYSSACQGPDCITAPPQPDPYYSLATGMDSILGAFGGPLSLGIKYDADLSWIANLGYTRMITDSFGLSAKLSGGANELRGNITAGVAITACQEFKVTYEYLYQNAPFDFDAGEEHAWIGQNAVGGAYQYIIPHSFFRAIQFSANWAEANNKNLDPEVVYEDNQPFADLERVAGGEENTELASVKFLPFSRALLTLGAGYSQVDYDTEYDTDSDANQTTVAYNADLSVLATPITKLTADVNNTASSRETDAKVNQLLPWSTELAVWGQYSKGNGDMPDSKSVMVSLSYPAPKAYAFAGLDRATELYNWINAPVVYYQRVLAISDQALQKYTISSEGLSDQTVNFGQSIKPVSTDNAFNFDTRIYDSVLYSLNVTKSGSSSDKNFAQALNLTITQNNNFTATVASGSGGTPEGTGGKYVVTITAKGEKDGLKQPITAKSSFKLTVASAPVWQVTTLPSATTGQPYPCVNLSDPPYATTQGFPDSDTVYSLVSSQPWLQIATKCLHPDLATRFPKGYGDSEVTYYLVAAGANQDTPVPLTGADPNVTLKATSNATGLSTKQNFTLTLNEIAPIWTGVITFSQDVDTTSLNEPLPVGSAVALDQYIQQGTGTGLTISLDPNTNNGSNYVPANWGIQQTDGHFYLIRTNNSGDEAGSTTIPIIATNSTSAAKVGNTIKLTLDSD